MKNERVVKIGATLDSISTRKDKSIKVVFETQEVTPEQGTALMARRDSYGWLIFVPSDHQEVEIPDEPPAEFLGQKSMSQRLRGAIHIWWEQSGRPGDSESFYREKMERFINIVKSKLDPEA